MARRIVVIQGHPDPDPGRLCRALADAYVAGAVTAGHVVDRVDLATLDFPLLRTQAEFEHGSLPPALLHAQRALVEAEHLVLIFPLWLGTMPALVKAFLEQVMRPGVAFDYTEGGGTRMKLRGRSARLVVTMGMPSLVYRLWFLGHGLRALERNILRFVGIGPIRTTLCGGVGTVGASTRLGWLQRVGRLGREAA